MSQDGGETEEEAQERPLKRLRPRDRKGQTSSNHSSNTGRAITPLIMPKEEPDQLPEAVAENTSVKSESATCQSIGNSKGKQRVTAESSVIVGRGDSVKPNGMSKSQQNSVPPMRLRDRGKDSDIPEAVAKDTREKSQSATRQSQVNNKGKQPVTQEPLIIQETSDSVQHSGMSRSQQNTPSRSEYIPTVHRMRLRDRGKGPASSQIPSKKKRPLTESSSHDLHIKEPKVEPGIVSSTKQRAAACPVLVEVKDEPTIDDIPSSEVPISATHPGLILFSFFLAEQLFVCTACVASWSIIWQCIYPKLLII